MGYYILYPENHKAKVTIVTKKPRLTKGYGYAEGMFRTIRDVIVRLNWRDVPNNRRPDKFKFASILQISPDRRIISEP